MNIQTVCETVGQSGCLLICDLVLIQKAGGNAEPWDAVTRYNDFVKEGIIRESDAYILDHERLLRLYGVDGVYAHTVIRPTEGLYEACFYYTGSDGKYHEHFVVRDADKKNMIINSLDVSECVNHGCEKHDWRHIV